MRILFAVDGSDCSREAIAVANKMKCPVGTELRVVSVVDFSEPLPVIEEAQTRERTRAQTVVQSTIQQLRETHPDAEVTGEMLEGNVIDKILQVSREWLADLIMVGSHGRKGILSLLLGSVSRAILLHAPCAVRIVRAGSEESKKREASNVLIAIDESEHSKHLVDHVLALPWVQGTQFRCLSVVREFDEDLFFDLDSGLTTTIEEHQADLLQAHKGWASAASKKINEFYDQQVASADVLTGDPREKILETSREWPADVIMLGSHGRRGIDKLIMGSVSESVAIRATCSVEVSRIAAFRDHKMHYIF
jgi:nucleotide-binding universal stress UspA family protein